MGAAQELLVHLVIAVRAEAVSELGQPRLGGLDLELALADVLQVLGGAHDHVHERAHEREQRGHGGAPDQQGVADPPPCVGERPVDERQPDHDQEQDDQVDGQIHPAVTDAEDGGSEH